MSAKQTRTQSKALILSSAGQRRNGSLLPLPDANSLTATKTTKLLNSMLKEGLIQERLTTSSKLAWRSDEAGKHYLLRITDAGRILLSEPVMAASSANDIISANPASLSEGDQPRVPSGKLGQVLAAVQTADGASIDDLLTLTGWQPHTIRASLSRLRQTGVSIALTDFGDAKRYVASGFASCEADTHAAA